MATTVSASSAWGRKPGAWALDSEEHEKELESMCQEQENSLPPETDTAFPSLAVAAATKQPKKNKKMSLAEFTSASNKSNSSSSLNPDVMLSLPTAPRIRSQEELDRNRLGGGFRSYGRGGDDPYGNSQPSRFSNRDGGKDRDRDRDREYMPSRADEVDDWSKTKKSSSFNGGYERRERNSGSMFDDSRSISKADESDNWASGKTVMEPRKYERRGSFDSLSRGRDNISSGGPDADNWGRKKEDTNSVGAPSGARPKLVLQPRTLPVNNPTSDPIITKPRTSNPFGEARPREEVLAQKGKDWKEIDEKLDAVKVGNSKEPEKKELYGWKKERGRFTGEDATSERSWRKPEASDSEARLQSAPDGDSNQPSETVGSSAAEAN